MKEVEDGELEALAELVPELKSKTSMDREIHTMTVDVTDNVSAEVIQEANDGIEVEMKEAKEEEDQKPAAAEQQEPEKEDQPEEGVPLVHNDSLMVQESAEEEDDEEEKPADGAAAVIAPPAVMPPSLDPDVAVDVHRDEDDQNLGGFDDVNSDHAIPDDRPAAAVKEDDVYNTNISSAASLSTATQTHEVRMPMYLPTFKPATGCTNASDFIVRCFVARLRSGITVVKHGRSRWCKSRLRILHIHPDGRSLTWKPAVGEPTSSKRPPKLDLSTCQEVRHAWSPDPLNPMFTGTSILRQKCEAANAHKSFALIFPKRTVDITAVTADQCKVLMEGFSALCFRLQVANIAGRGKKKGEEEEVATASVTLTNNSTLQQSPPTAISSKRRQ
jgi:hypothetical protein